MKLKLSLHVALSYLLCHGAQAAHPKVEMNDVPVENSFIVVIKDPEDPAGVPGSGGNLFLSPDGQLSVQAAADALTAENPAIAVTAIFEESLKGFAVRMTTEEAEAMAESDAVAYISQDGVVQANAVDTWGLDRIDQRDLPLDDIYNAPGDGKGVTAYIIDTGIRTTHEEFDGGRATFGINTVGDNNNSDCNGHGTHVAGTVAGKEYGVANKADLVAVKVLSCSGSGTWAGVLQGIEWVQKNAKKPATANLSLGGGKNTAIDNAVNALHNSGVVTVVAAGNSNANACNYSPAGATDVISVGSTTNTDARSSFSNWGDCVEIWAPGSNIKSAWKDSNSNYRTISGTSMASPHVCGGAALYLAAGVLPPDVLGRLEESATPDKVNDPKGAPNLLLYVEEANPTISPKPTSYPTSAPSLGPTLSSEPSSHPSSTPTASPTDSSKPTTHPSSTPSARPTESSQPSGVPSPAPTRFNQDSVSLFVRNGKKRKCRFVEKRTEKMCQLESIKRFCPRTCEAGEEFGCVDADLPFVLGTRRERQWTCEEVANLDPALKKAKCDKDKFYTTCRDTCGMCGGEPILIDFDENGDSTKAYYRDDLTLENYYTVNGKQSHPGSGYDYGTKSQPLTGFNGFGRPMTMSCPGGSFSLTSVWMTPAWANGLTVKLEGYSKGTLKHTYTTTLASTKSAEFYSTELSGLSELDSLTITTSPSQVVLDDMLIEMISPCLGNIARGKPTAQSTTCHSGASSRAVDGNTNSNWSGNSITHTCYDGPDWWEVRLGELYDIKQLQIYNRQDCCGDRLREFSAVLYNGDEEVWRYKNPPGTPPAITTIDVEGATPQIGDRIRISIEQSDPLSLAEVLVIGTKA